jgi:hypothetical protein
MRLALRSSEKRNSFDSIVNWILSLAFAMLIAVAPGLAQSPVITSISPITTQQFQTIVISGSGFGTQNPYTGVSDYISLLDTTKGWQAGYEGCLLGFCTTDTVTLVVNSWTDTKITLGGFSGAWGTDGYTLSVGDSEQVSVFNPQTSAGPGQMTVTVVGETTTTTLTSTPNPSNVGETVTFTVTVDSRSGPPPDGETVSFMQGKQTVGKATLKDGTATVKTSALSKGTHTIVAVYNGDANFGGSKSKPVMQVVQ